jgi:hypothetical protein
MSFAHKYLKLYRDGKFNEPITQVKFEKIVDAGQSGIISLSVRNISAYELIDIVLLADDKEVSFRPAKIPELPSGRTAQVTIVWSPSVTRKTPLTTKVYGKFKVIKRV